MYKICLPNFEGPFDLLLYFIKKEEINIYDIPIARISEEFLKYIKFMQELDLDVASEFIYMASLLMYIKCQMLLPRKLNNSTGEIEDPRTELVNQLIEYKKYKALGKKLAILEQKNQFILYRNLFDADAQLVESLNMYNLSIMSLIKALKKALQKSKLKSTSHQILIDDFDYSKAEQEIMQHLEKRKRIKFSKLAMNRPKNVLIVLFLVLLELVKTKKIYIRQDSNFEDFSVGLMPTLN